MEVKFTLVYRGPLHGGKSTARERQGVREYFHPQLEILCQKTEQFSYALRDDLRPGVLKKGVVDMERPIIVPFYNWHVGNFRYVPLVTSAHELACALDVVWFRREPPGNLMSAGGDLDNRLKGLLDGLRMPMDKGELAGATAAVNTRRFALLDDDRRVTRFSVTTHELLEKETPGEKPSFVEAFIHVTVYPTYFMMGNLGF